MTAGGDEACPAGGGELAEGVARGDTDFALSLMVAVVTRVLERSAVTETLGVDVGWKVWFLCWFPPT